MDKAAIQTLVSELYTAVKPFPELQKNHRKTCSQST